MEAKYVRVKFLKAASGFAYNAGDTGVVLAEKVEQLLKGGYVLIVPEEEKENPLPEDLPGRDKLFQAGFDTLEKIKGVGDGLLEAGISKTLFKKIQDYFKDK
ncbi:MAG: hypothetical protein GX459_12005 [Bacteroidales bacterium]|nr:hypothetical protein [Bacteroidales bacterium]